METVIECLIYEERKLKEKQQGSQEGNKEEVMVSKHKKKGPRCHFCNRFGHIQRNCREREKKLGGKGAEGTTTGKSQSHLVRRHEVNSLQTKRSSVVQQSSV